MQLTKDDFFPAASFSVPTLELALVRCSLVTTSEERDTAISALFDVTEFIQEAIDDRPLLPFLCADAVLDLTQRVGKLRLVANLLELPASAPPRQLISDLFEAADALFKYASG